MSQINIVYNRTWNEYIVKHPSNKEAHYHTDDKNDAIETAINMAYCLGLEYVYLNGKKLDFEFTRVIINMQKGTITKC